MFIDGILIHVDDRLVDDKVSIQFRFPKSKKVRIRKKFAKNIKNYKLKEVEGFIKFGNNIILSPKAYEKLKKHIVKDDTGNN